MRNRLGVLAVDEGTTGTRAAWVDEHGAIGGIRYERLTVNSPRPRVVEQDAAEILDKTVTAIRVALSDAAANGVAITSIAIATQRATAVLWDTVTGDPLAPAIVWQDTRFADDLAALGPGWNERLIPRVGRGTGVRSPYLTARRMIDDDAAVSAAHRQGRLGFGTIDTWLLWNLVQGRPLATTATNATSCGAYELRAHRYAFDYIEALGLPLELLPSLHDDGTDFGITDPDLLGAALPVRTVIGDLHAGMIGLGALDEGDAMCVHGTGSFVDLNLGSSAPARPGLYDGALSLVAWRAEEVSRYSIETFTAATGSALDWLCSTLGWFESAKAISQAAASATRRAHVQFVPAMTGVRMPVVDPDVTTMLAGIDFSTTREDVAVGVLDGIAQSMAWSLEADAEVAGVEASSVTVGGGLAGSDPLVQMQADLTRVPQVRWQGTEYASLRGAAFLAGVGTLWDDLASAKGTLAEDAVFEPRISESERDERVGAWRSRVTNEIDLTTRRRSADRHDEKES